MPSVYVGTYSKYNRGSIGGAWLDLEDYGDKDEFMKACQELHADEYDPEFMFQNYEGIPSQFITECSVKAEFWDYMYSTVNEEVKAAYMELFGEWNEKACNDRYYGEFRSPTKLAEEIAERSGMLKDLPENLQYYFDYEAFGRDLMLGEDFSEENGHYFHN